jgi:uncharacterized protein YndB with AHSA1/START domain
MQVNIMKLQARNEMIINAPVKTIWSLITDVNMLHKINPGVVKASGRMDRQGETRTCELNNNGRKGTMTERLIELIPDHKTVWAIESDTMGMKKMMKDARFVFNLEQTDEGKVKVISETFYQPGNFMARLLNGIMMKKMIGKAQAQILANLKTLSEQ